MTLDEMIAQVRANLEPWPDEPDVIVTREDGSLVNEDLMTRFVGRPLVLA